jgi:hypothetical protein
MAGSHQNTAVRFKRIVTQGKETVADALTREGILDSAVFIFLGHPLLEGEEKIERTQGVNLSLNMEPVLFRRQLGTTQWSQAPEECLIKHEPGYEYRYFLG